MGWSYHFIFDLTPEEKYLRRLSLDRSALVAQLSALAPVLLLLLCRSAIWVWSRAARRRVSYDAVPSSPARKARRHGAVGRWATQARKWRWWLGDDVQMLGQSWGQRDQWILGAAWTVWLFVLCTVGTGQGKLAELRRRGRADSEHHLLDYMHLTKRFGIIAASQFPIHYLMSLKTLNPFAYIFGSSHEHLNKWHRVLGRILYFLLFLHAVFYLNFFVRINRLDRLLDPVVAFGVVSFIGLNLLTGTAARFLRQHSYRLFFIVHVAVAVAMPPLLFFHSEAMRTFMAEAVVVFFADLAVRKFGTVTSDARLQTIPGTDLVTISAPVSSKLANRFRERPGSHAYLTLPAASRPSSSRLAPSSFVFEMLHNPFTVAAVGENTPELTLVARRRHGPLTQALSRIADAQDANPASSVRMKASIGIEGPYGVAKYFPSFSAGEYDKILLVAGGVGATFILPLYHAITQDDPRTKVEMIWTVRSAADVTWAVHGDPSEWMFTDDNVHVHVTGGVVHGRSAPGIPGSGAEGDVEMSALHQNRKRDIALRANMGRPDFRKIVDGVFKSALIDGRVAVLVCGPAGMVRDLRKCVGVWVEKGRSVFWHDESFGW